MRQKGRELMSEHHAGCPRLQFWDAGAYEAACTCGPGAPLEADVVVSMRRERRRGKLFREIALGWGVSTERARMAVRGITFRNVDDEPPVSIEEDRSTMAYLHETPAAEGRDRG